MEEKLTLAETAVLNCIPTKKPIFKEDIITRKDISEITGISIREVSNIIERLRRHYPICSSRGIAGYWLGNREEALRFAQECRSHAEGLLETARNIEAMCFDE